MTSPADPVLTVVGIGADGWHGLPEGSRREIASADVLVGGPRQLRLVPDGTAEKVAWPRPLRAGVVGLLERHADRRVVVLASGDPMLSGVGSMLVGMLGPGRVRVVPALSSVALARARMGWPAESVDVVSVVGRDLDAVRRTLTPGRRLVVLSADESTPAALCALLADAGYGGSEVTVLGDLGAAQEVRVEGVAADWHAKEPPRLNLVCLTCRPDPGVRPLAAVPGLPDEAFEHDGQLTKRDVRAAALARLGPCPGELLWDVGAGAGSVAIEWMRTDPRCRATAVEADPRRAERIGRNARRLGVPRLDVVTGRAPDVLAGLDSPDAVFVGGGVTEPRALDTCWAALRPGGRMVVHAVTVETERVLGDQWARRGGELTRLSVEQMAPLGGFHAWSPARAVVQWAVLKEERG